MSAISDIVICYSNIGKKCVRLKNCHSEIGRVGISISESIPIYTIESIPVSTINIFFIKLESNSGPLAYVSALPFSYSEKLNVRYWIKAYADLQYYVGLCFLQSDIRGFDIRLSPIPPITDIGLSAHLCFSQMPGHCWHTIKKYMVKIWNWTRPWSQCEPS
jgi:hypothetical protein